MKRLRVFTALFAVVCLSPVLAADSADRPAGVEARNWLPISEGFGLKIDSEEARACLSDKRRVPPRNGKGRCSRVTRIVEE